MHVVLGAAAAILVFFLALASDYLETLYTRAVMRWERAPHIGATERARHDAARFSVLMWLVGCVGLVCVVEVGWWVLLPEGAGLYLGTMLALRR